MDELVPFFQESMSDLKLTDFEDGDAIPDEDIYDAVNDETFGAEISSISNDDDLEGFSTRTANLALFDEQSCSVQLPDPSQIPIPQLRTGVDEEKRNGAAESISSIWDSGSFNGIGSLTENYVGHLKMECQNVSRDEQKNQLQRMIDAGLSIVNHSPLEDTRHTPSSLGKMQLPKMPIPSEASTHPLSVEELERRMLMEASAHQQQRLKQNQFTALQQAALYPNNQQQQQQQPLCNPALITPEKLLARESIQTSVTAGNPLSLLPPHLLLQQIQLAQRYQVAALVATAANRIPPPLSQMPFYPHSQNAPVVPRQCHDMTPTIMSNNNMAMVPVPTSTPVPHLMAHSTSSSAPLMPQLMMVPSSLHPRAEKHRRSRQTGLPSGKTISDFALDPYAGFMSTKEREWLIKIQIIQCLGSGDPLEDDYYYTVWKQQNTLQKAPEQWKNKENPKYYKFEATFLSTGYTAPSFLGSLGKPIHSSANQPRQIIEVTSENTDEDLSSSKNHQKRLRAALMKIENGALSLLDCRSIRRKLRFFEETRITEYLDQREVTNRTARFADNLAHIDAGLFSIDTLPTMMLIQKGRHTIYDWLKFWGEEGDHANLFFHIYRILTSAPKFVRKIPEEALKQFVEVVCYCFSEFPFERILEALHCTGKWELSLISENKLMQLILMHLLVAVINKTGWNLKLDELQGTGAFLLLHSHNSSLKLDPNSPVDSQLFKPNQWAQLRQWLLHEQSRTRSSLSTKNTIIRWILESQI